MMLFDTANPFYSVLYFLLIIGFSYFYATMQFNPIEVANNLKKNGGFIPGFRLESPLPTLSPRCSTRSPCSAHFICLWWPLPPLSQVISLGIAPLPLAEPPSSL